MESIQKKLSAMHINRVKLELIVTSHELFLQQAPAFNFEKNEQQLLEHALKVGFVSSIQGFEELYLINMDYKR